MGRIARFGTALALGGALAVVASGCGSASHKAPIAPTAQQLAVKTAESYAKTQVVGTMGGFKAQQQSNGGWKVSFSGKFTLSNSMLAVACKKNHLVAGARVTAPWINAAYLNVSESGLKRIGYLTMHMDGALTTVVTCPAS